MCLCFVSLLFFHFFFFGLAVTVHILRERKNTPRDKEKELEEL